MIYRIPLELVRTYFDYVISEYVDEYEDVPRSMSDLTGCLPNLKAYLMKNNEQLIFTSALIKALQDTEGMQKYYGYSFPLEDDEIRDVMRLLLKFLSLTDCFQVDNVEIRNIPLKDFRIKKKLIHQVKEGETLETISQKTAVDLEIIKKANPYWVDKCGIASTIKEGEIVRLKLTDKWH